MADEIFKGTSELRIVLDTETDADSPDNENTYGAMRKSIEAAYMLLFDTDVNGSITQDPSGATITDTNATFDVDAHNGRTLLFTSGAAVGNFYTIDDGDSSRLIVTGDDPFADGVRQGDDYKVLYDIKVNKDGHDHDGVNSPQVVLPLGRQLIACYADEVTYSGTSFVEKLRWQVYVPTNPIYVNAYLEMYTNTGGTASFRLKLIDSAASTFTSNQVDVSSTVWIDKELTNFDISAAAAGVGQVTVEMMRDANSAKCHIRALTIIYNS